MWWHSQVVRQKPAKLPFPSSNLGATSFLIQILMRVSNLETAVFTLVPGLLEIVESEDLPSNLKHVKDLATWIREERDTLFTFIVLTTTAATGAVYFRNSPIIYYSCETVAICGTLLSCCVAKRLYDAAKCMQQHVNTNLVVRKRVYNILFKQSKKGS